MLFYIKLAWRNIFRNKRRTVITSIAIGIGLASLMFSDALIIGMEADMIKSVTASFLGEAQIHGKDFRDTQEAAKTIAQLDKVVEELQKDEVVEKFTLRALSFGMVTSPANVNAVVLVGVDPETEVHMSQIDETIREGGFFKEGKDSEIVIGSGLADILEVTLGDRVVATVAQAGGGELAQEMFRISGIYHFNIKEMDTGMAFIRLDKARKMMAIGKGAHQIALKFTHMDYALDKKLPFWEKYAQYGNEPASWADLLPQLKAVFDMTGLSTLIMGLILFSVVFFGIVNTLFMSLHERMFEFAVLRAVGTRAAGVRKLMICEAGAMGVISIIIGVILGLALTLIMAKVGIDYRGIEMAGTTIREMIYPVFRPHQLTVYPAVVLLFMLVVGLYPAYVAGKMSIAHALRKSL